MGTDELGKKTLLRPSSKPRLLSGVMKTPMSTSDVLVWLDLETPGLDPRNPKWQPLELGLRVTDGLGEVTLNSSSWLIQPKIDEEELYASVDEFVEKMHTDNNLWIDAMDKGHWIKNVEEDAIEWLEKNSLSSGVIPMSGANVRFDRNWVEVHMPKLNDRFHYRPGADVSSLREVCKLVNKPVHDAMPKVSKNHRVTDCLDGAVEQYKFMVDNFFFVA